MMPPVISCFDIPEEVLEDYIFSRISGNELEEFEEHLVVCQVCASRLTDLRSFIDLLRLALLPDTEPQTAEDPDAYVGPERRVVERRTTRRLVEVFDLAIPASLEPTTSILADASVRGLGLVCGHFVRPDTRVCVDLNDELVYGVVRNARQFANGWRIGVERTPTGA